ncbi:hypothetical protein [Acidovorax sp. BLS4]|uniref:hypothetical protein n=1 Tax=Acidovorax sp. BLS4 TaxID=3273430 RepID=UPI0029436D5B|nr:hypothetical protein [Paracidovorax avenae]WOI45584.1 hypothetical protein R1Z03_24520 [Paracidovorax avenae]
MQCNRDASLEFYMGRTGLYLQISRQSTTQRQLGAGLTAGYGIAVDGAYAAAGVSAAVDWRYRREVGVEDGLQIRIPRLGKGHSWLASGWPGTWELSNSKSSVTLNSLSAKSRGTTRPRTPSCPYT